MSGQEFLVRDLLLAIIGAGLVTAFWKVILQAALIFFVVVFLLGLVDLVHLLSGSR